MSLLEQLHQDKSKKNYTYGTQRICTPEQTWEKIRPLLGEFGITRVADITWLDRIGIPVYVAIRPNGKTLAQSNGKGVTAMAAKVSTVMESIEVWHAEEIQTTDLVASIEEMHKNNLLSYDPFTLSSSPIGFFCESIPLEWMKAEDLTTNCHTYVPKELMNLSWEVNEQACLPSFLSNTVGLASGNSILEATLHGLCEVLECDAIVQYNNFTAKNPKRLVDKTTISSDICLQLINQYEKAGAKLYIEDISSEFGVAVLQANITFEDHLGISMGYGCHPNREIALLRALTEAAQCRATVISGARDDISAISYYIVKNTFSEVRFEKELTEKKNLVDFRTITNSEKEYIEDDLQDIINSLKEKLGTVVMMTDLSRKEYGISVAKVVVPILQHPLHKMGSIRASRSAQANVTRED